MNELEKKIKKYADLYYAGQEAIPDQEYDRLIEILKEKYPDSELLKNGVIGSDLKGVNKKYKLEATMGTLSKCNTDEEMKDWWKKHPHDDLVAELKIDGNGQLLTYENRNLQYTRSRGDGEYGEDTTENVKKVNGVIHNLPKDFNGQIRGEVVMLRSVFEKYFPDSKNPRNMAAGIIKRLDGKDCEKLQFIAYDVFDINHKVDKTEVDKLNFLKECGFMVPEYVINPKLDDLKKWKDSLNPNGEIPCDGIVIKQNKVDYEDLQRHTPLNNVAYKPKLQNATTIIKKIEWQLKGRYFGPVAIVEPVELEGTTVEKASLSNVNIMNELGVYEGAEVIMSKHGMIIPSVDLVITPKKNAFSIPTVCPVCGGKVEVNNSGIPECINEECPRKVGHRFRRMFKVFGIKGTGDAFINNLEENEVTIKQFLDMCKLDDKTVLNKYAGGINGEKVYIQMKEAMGKQISAAKFLATFDVKLFDEKKLNQLGNKTLDEILLLKYNDIINIEGFAETTANALIKFIDNYIEEISDLRKYFTFKSIYEETNLVKENKLESKGTVVFTGACEQYKRSELSEIATKAGWEVKDSVTKDVTLLVCADPNSGSSKLQKAAKNGTKIISYEEFLAQVK